MNNETLYRVTFTGVVSADHDVQASKAQFGVLFGLRADQTERLFSGKEFVLKDQASAEVARAFAQRVSETGCECYIEAAPNGDWHQGDADRRQKDRRTATRHLTRPGDTTERRRDELVGRRRDDGPALPKFNIS